MSCAGVSMCALGSLERRAYVCLLCVCIWCALKQCVKPYVSWFSSVYGSDSSVFSRGLKQRGVV